MLELIIAVILSSIPIMLAATGELVVERSGVLNLGVDCLLYTSPSPRDISGSRMPSSA